ncbi:MAG: hypothetical protein WC683_12685 [bacterium]
MSEQEEITSKITKYTMANDAIDTQIAGLDLTTMFGRVTKVELFQAHQDNDIRIANLTCRLAGLKPAEMMSDDDTAHMDAFMSSEDGRAYR